MAEKQILIVCGEASGDLNAANLAKNILKINPKIKIFAVGGNLLKQAGAEIIYDIKDLSVMGFFDVLKKLPNFFALKKFVLEKIARIKPDLIILVDFSGFNLRLAKDINKSIPIIYYISPQVWASRAGRINTIKEYISKMIVLFKFEEDFYKKHGVNVDLTGHPLLDIVKPSMDKNDFISKYYISGAKKTIAILPGSRKAEIKNILPIMLEAAEILSKKIPDIQFVIAKSPQVDMKDYKSIMSSFNFDIKIIEGKTYDCLNVADFCFVCSGTATLETAIMQKPFCIIYKMNLLNYLLYRPQVKIPFIGMVNIVADKLIVPEFIQFRARPEDIAEKTLEIINLPSEINRIKDELAKVKDSLGETGASARAAKIVVDYLK
ncbi:MAG: lipid-A-disaccharide synthase [Candidatus Omnitrophica bacterium]|nr:lipid-A-disaccharide synthase [Candidatus Omnitrophota bacterium]